MMHSPMAPRRASHQSQRLRSKRQDRLACHRSARVLRFESLEKRLLLATVVLTPSKDTTLIELPADRSNATGELFVGRVSLNQNRSLRRGIIAFDFSAIPSQSTVTAASLDMFVSRSRIQQSSRVSLQKMTADWGEGTSSFIGGRGTAPTTNDVTWTHRFFPGTTWSTAGGDFVSTASAIANVRGTSTTPTCSAPGMVTDIQGWLDAPATNFGWILLGEIFSGNTIKKFNSKEIGSNPPQLTVTFTEPAASLTVSIAAAEISEGAGVGAATATVARSGSTANALVVNLNSNDPGEAAVPASVTIAAGQASSPAFNIDAVDDNVVDGTQTVTITASATDVATGTDNLNVLDDDVTALTLVIAADSISETAGPGATTATVSRHTNTSSSLVVNLNSGDTTEATVQASVTIAAGQATSVPFNINAVDDAIVDGTQTVTVTGSATGLADGTDTVDVTDNEVPANVLGHVLNGGSTNRSGIDTLLLQFSQPVTLGAAGAVKVRNHTTGSAVDISAATLLNDGTAGVTVNLGGITLPDGFYTAKLPASLGLVATHSLPFHVLPGDSSGDGQVGFGDFGALAGAFNTVLGPKYGPGDFDGDGNVGFGDFGILAANFNRSLAAPQLDFGDALENGTSFPVTLPNGARHVLGSGLLLGATVAPEPNGQPGVAATGDGADEDGVTFATLQAGSNAAVTVTATVPSTAVSNAWIDFNRDNDWDDAGEQIFVDRSVSNGTNNLTAAVPAGALAGPAYARFRITACEGHSYSGLAPDGEVEDYRVTLVTSLSRPVVRVPTVLIAVGTAPSNAATRPGPTGAGSDADPLRQHSDPHSVDLAVAEMAVSPSAVPQLLERGDPLKKDLLNQVFETGTGELLTDITTFELGLQDIGFDEVG